MRDDTWALGGFVFLVVRFHLQNSFASIILPFLGVLDSLFLGGLDIIGRNAKKGAPSV